MTWPGVALPIVWPLALLLGAAEPAFAKVEVAFHSRDSGGAGFPHAFVTLRGTVDSTGETIDTALGFTSRAMSPAILVGPVPGTLIAETKASVARSTRHFSLILTDEQYRSVNRIVQKWRNARQPSYDFHRRNCVHFVGEVAAASGLRVVFAERLMKQPREFVLSLMEANALGAVRRDARGGADPRSRKAVRLTRLNNRSWF